MDNKLIVIKGNTIRMQVTDYDAHYQIQSGDTIYLINKESVQFNRETACESVRKILNQDPTVKLLSYNRDNLNYYVDNILVNAKSIKSESKSKLKTKSLSKLKTKPKRNYIVISETPEMYDILKENGYVHTPGWVSDIFTGVATGEIIYKETDDYFLMPDFKWDQQPNHLYLLVLFKDLTLKSIRDLNQSHLNMLNRVSEDISQYISDQYNLDRNKFRMFFHYQPSAWQLHLHIQHIDSLITKTTMICRAHLLSDIVRNICLKDDYYKTATLECIITESDYHDLYLRD